MQRNTTVMLICIALMLSISSRVVAQHAEKSTLYFAPLPMSSNKLNLIKALPIADYLSETLQRPVIPKLYQSYDEIIKAFLAGEVHLLEIGPQPLIELQNHSQDAIPLASINQNAQNNHYHCVLAAPIDGLQQVSDIKQAKTTKVALTQPLSTCGPLLTQYLLKQSDVDINNLSHQFLGSHEEVALSLIRNEAVVGGLARFIAERYQGLGLNILATSPALPTLMMVANRQTIRPQEIESIKQALLNYQPNESSDIGKYGFSPVTIADIEAFRAFAKQINPSLLEKR